MISREELIKLAQKKQRLNELKSSISDPGKRALLDNLEKSLTDAYALSSKKNTQPSKITRYAERQSTKESVRKLTPFAESQLKKHNIGSDFVSKTYETDKLIGVKQGSTLSQMFAESSFNPKAISKSGALGIAQILPATRRSLEKRLKRKLNPFSLNDALILHREVMKENMERFKDFISALKAYNGGTNPKLWPKKTETVEYPGKVEEAEKLLFGDSKKSKQI